MQEILDLGLILIWGGVLGFFYQIIALMVKRCRKLTYLLWTIGGLVFFFTTSGFLFYLNNGAVGLYGFPFMVLGFGLYLHFLCGKMKKILRPIYNILCGLLKIMACVCLFVVRIFLVPLGVLARIFTRSIGFFARILAKTLPKKHKASIDDEGINLEM